MTTSNVDDWKRNADTLRQVAHRLIELAERVESGNMEMTGSISMEVSFQTINTQVFGGPKSFTQGEIESVSLISDIQIRVRCP